MKQAILTALCVLAAAGCRSRPEPPRPTDDPATQAATNPAAPEVPEQFAEDLSAGSTEILVNTDGPAVRAEPTYVRRPDCPSGKLSGICVFTGKLKVPPTPKPEDLAKGPYAIKDPQPGEVDYYRNIKVYRPRYYRHGRRHREYFPTHVVLRMRDIKAGRRPPLMPTGFMAIHGYVKGLRGNHGNRTNITFAALNARVTFFTYEAHPCTFLLDRAETGERIFQGRVAYLDKGRKNAHEVGGGHKIWIASKPEPIQSPILRHPGLYRVSTVRHPWKIGCLFLVDNPYVEVVQGGFEIKDIPVGRHRMDVWHPAYEPLRKTVEFEIVADETAEVRLEFKPPAELSAETKTTAGK